MRPLTPPTPSLPASPPTAGREGDNEEHRLQSPSSPGGRGGGRERRAGEVRAPRTVAAEVLETEAAAIRGLVAQLDEHFDRAVELLRACAGRVVCTGMGKSGIVMKKVAATLSSTGTPSLFLHPAEAVHGDLGMIVPGDIVLAASYSGTTEELLRLVATLKRIGIPLVAMTANAASPLARHADLHLPVAIDREACPLGLAPTASTTATLAMGDALAMALVEARGFTREDFARLHPAGQLGKRLLKVDQLMHAGAALPQVGVDTPMREAIYEMSKKGFWHHRCGRRRRAPRGVHLGRRPPPPAGDRRRDDPQPHRRRAHDPPPAHHSGQRDGGGGAQIDGRPPHHLSLRL